MKKEFGKWLMDIAKYIATAILLSSVFGEVETWVLYLISAISVALALGCGLLLVSEKSIVDFFKIRRVNNPESKIDNNL